MNTKTNTKTKTNTNTPVRDSLTTEGATSAPKPAQYKFWVSTREEYIEWTGLTAKRAKDMYAYTNQSQPSNVTSFGWEEMK